MADCKGENPNSQGKEDHERAYFDSADWVLGKQGANNNNSRNAVESLKPKLKRTPHHQLPPRKPTCAST
ncbi:cAMP-regulated phosphoprotein 19-related protein [Rhynchospora pubera]|uniref:cAMP-regulated phosphoprotein 19-related protein n=1 Tax=Rhynchospora pubera TaxID=906938 RepID=A0AAV8DC53_9POAL|nr:cAMP-regulated phosphoprotein 19-related protein [Rhynchospora pubera]